jgi:fatty acid desaturase
MLMPTTVQKLSTTTGSKFNSGSSSISSLSDASLWHRDRRKEMLAQFGDQIRHLEMKESSQKVALPILVAANLLLLGLSILSGRLPIYQVILLSIFPGSILSLWQLQILHDNLHGSLLDKSKSKLWGVKKSRLQDVILFLGSMPSVFGYYLYLKRGHLTHHTNVGNKDSASLAQLFDSPSPDFEDGDVLFVAHRMKLKGAIGPTFSVAGKEIKMSIAKSGLNMWKDGSTLRNMIFFAVSFMYERIMLVVNDALVALIGRNLFFPNKPANFHSDCTLYARVATVLRLSLWKFSGMKALLFLYLSETLWSIPPHPCCSMFVTNHGSPTTPEGECSPSSSTYAGRWYSVLTLGTNFHTEHHDFPTIPLNQLWKLRQIAPEYYRPDGDNVWSIMKQAFRKPDYYACMDVGVGSSTRNR